MSARKPCWPRTDKNPQDLESLNPMRLTDVAPKSESGDFKPVPAGQYFGCLRNVYGLGTHYTEFQGKGKYVKKVVLVWELDYHHGSEDKKADKRATVMQWLTLSTYEKAPLMAFLKSWLGAEFDLDTLDFDNLLDRGAYIGITNEKKADGKMRDNVSALMPLPPRTESIKPEGDSFTWFVETDLKCTDSRIPDWVRNQGKKSREYETEASNTAAPSAWEKSAGDRFGGGSGEPVDPATLGNDDIPY